MEVALVSAATGALKPILVKLVALLGEKYKRFKKVHSEIDSLTHELTAMHAFLVKMSEEEDPEAQDTIWMNEVRELSYDMEDSIDEFMRCVDDKSVEPDGFIEKIKYSLGKVKARHRISNEINDLKKEIFVVAGRNDRYKIAQTSSKTSHTTVDPRSLAMFEHASRLVGIDEPKMELSKLLMEKDGCPSRQQQLKVLAIVGSGGMGKTTLANQVYQEFKMQFECRAFISVSRNPDMMTILRTLLNEVSNQGYANTEDGSIQQLIIKITDFLVNKSYFVVIDDVWDMKTLEVIKCALPVNNYGSRIITTTRLKDVANSCCQSPFNGHIYNIRPLSMVHSRCLFRRRLFNSEDDCPPHLEEVSEQILKKCDGLPLAINAICGLLATKVSTKDQWDQVKNSIGRALERDHGVQRMIKILSLSYFDLLPHLKSCLLYLSIFPEDNIIRKDSLIKRWIAEGFIHDEGRYTSYELGERCFNELVNRSLIQPQEPDVYGKVESCKIHDTILDFIISKSVEENFVTLVGVPNLTIQAQSKIRRLSLHVGKQGHSILPEGLVLPHVRSLNVFGDSREFPSLDEFKHLRVLDFGSCYQLENHHLANLGRLFQLRHLNVRDTGVSKLPKEIRNLFCLEMLDLRGTDVRELPADIANLGKLAHLLIDNYVKLPDGLGKMQSLEMLEQVGTFEQSLKCLQQLGQLKNLRKLHLDFKDYYDSEVDKEMPIDKAPGPDGFNGLFLKNCWPMVKKEFYKLVKDFYDGNINLCSINTAFITLIPKISDPENMNDFRPISLVSLPMKFLTKLLANRMQKIIIPTLHANQYGFIKGKNIQDCLGWAFEYLHICHQSKKPIILLKIDFEKAFDKVEYSAVIDMLKAKGYGPKWVSMVSNILNSASTSVLLNGTPGKKIICKRGVRQGDPLSPILFVNTADLLQSAINEAWNNGDISLPVPNDFGQKYPVAQYADDTILIMPADATQLILLKGLLEKFSASTGLQVNYHKTSLVPININTAEANNLAHIFGCKVESLPFTYLGLPLGTTRPSVADLMPLVSRMDKKLSGINSLMTYTGRLTLLNSLIQSMPMFAMCSLKIHVTIFIHFEKSGRQFLWAGKEIDKHGKCLANWDMVCRPKDQGGLGVLNLRTQNKALLMKNIHKFYNNMDIPWVQLIRNAHYTNNRIPHASKPKGSFWWKDCLALFDQYKQIACCKPKDGRSILMWTDKWNDSIKEDIYPQLFSFTVKEKISLNAAWNANNNNIYEIFQLPLTAIAHEQLLDLKDELNDFNPSSEPDNWIVSASDTNYQTRKIYRKLLGDFQTPQPILDIWKTCCLPRHKFFTWLLLNRRLNTKDHMKKKHFFVEFSDCVLCDTCPEESILHLFFECSFSQSFWWALGFEWNTDHDIISMIEDAKTRYTYNFLMEIMITGFWSIWEQRNDAIFKDIDPTVHRCIVRFKSFISLSMLRAKPSLKEGMQSWLDTL